MLDSCDRARWCGNHEDEHDDLDLSRSPRLLCTTFDFATASHHSEHDHGGEESIDHCAMSNTVSFPTGSDGTPPDTASALSIAHRHTALEVCDLVYGPTLPTWDAIERFYETNATYENPLVTATSRAVIADVHAISSQLAQLDIPRPLALLYGMFGLSRGRGWGDPWFKFMSMWNEVTDVAENESFDGHQKTIVEHVLHIDLLPGLLSSSLQPNEPTSNSVVVPLSLPYRMRPPSLSARGHGGQSPPPSILHLSLPMMTRLSFNDAGKITHHRDFWDVKDLLNLLPGISLAQWVTTRLVAQGIRGVVGASRILLRSRSSRRTDGAEGRDEEEGVSPAAAYARAVKDHP